MESELYNKLTEYCASDMYPFHMPGHKRNPEAVSMADPFSLDITEIKGFDNLHNPKGVLEREMRRAADFYGSAASYFLVNGSTCGLFAAIACATEPGDKIIIGRNSHASVYRAVEMLRLRARYVYPRALKAEGIQGGFAPEDVRSALEENRDAAALVITSPTYEGVVSDVRTICASAGEYGIPVIVDAAHGAHFILSDLLPEHAVKCGADIVVESLHKTLPSLTQTAILHYNSDRIDRKRLEKCLSAFQTSSPSYILMASICNCIQFIINRREYAEQRLMQIAKLREALKDLKNIHLLSGQCAGNDGVYDLDFTKLLISDAKGVMTGKDIGDRLRERYHLEIEMASGRAVLCMTSVCDTDEGLARLKEALFDLDKKLDLADQPAGEVPALSDDLYTLKNERICEIYEAQTAASANCGEYVYLYPPGIPVLVPGERAGDKLKDILAEYERAGYEVVRS